MRVLFLTYIPSPYRVDFFNEFGKQCELTVVFEKASASHRDESWRRFRFDNFKGIVLSESKKGQGPNFGVIKYIKDKKYDEIIVHNVSTPTGMLAVQYMKSHHIKYWIESDGGFAKSGKGFKECVKRHFIKGAKGYFSTCIESDKYLTIYGAESDKIYRYPFTSLKKGDALQTPLDKNSKKKIRRELDIKEEYMVISVGRFSYLGGYGKGYDVLMKAAEGISKDIGIYIIGDEPTQEFVDLKKSYNLTNVHFIGFKSKVELREYYLAADLFVLMTISDVWGLVINEAMSLGLPIITTYMCGAGLELVEDNKNGFLVNVGDVGTLKENLESILYDENLRNRMSSESIRKISHFTYFDMVMAHMNAFNS